MDKTTLGLVAALGAAAMTPAAARTVSTDNILKPASVAQLLEPVANPLETLQALKASDQAQPVEVADEAITVGPNGIGVHHHHHHHHHHQMIVIRRHRHHHHHHNN